MSELLERPWIRDTKIGSETLGQVIQRQIRVRFAQGGPLDGRAFVPDTPAAKDFLGGKEGPKFEASLRGLLTTVDAGAGTPRLDGIALAVDEPGWIANAVMSAAQVGELTGHAGNPDDWAKGSAWLVGWCEQVIKQGGRAGIYWTTPGVNLGLIDIDDISASAWRTLHDKPQTAQVPWFRGATVPSFIAGSTIAHVVRHELHHSVSPPNIVPRLEVDVPGIPDLKINWLEEGSAELLTYWPGVKSDLGRQLDLPSHEKESNRYLARHPYRPFADTVEGLIRLGGIDTTRPDALKAADEILQAHTVSRVPGRLARQIISHHGLDPVKYEWLRNRIIDLKGRPDGLPALADDIKSLRSSSRTQKR